MPKFRKNDKLCNKKQIDNLFTVGYSFSLSPFRVNILTEKFQSNNPAKILIVVSKKRFKSAVTRNLIKRKIREAYRLNRKVLYDMLQKNKIKILFSLIYIGKETTCLIEVDSKIIAIFNKIEEVIKQYSIQE